VPLDDFDKLLDQLSVSAVQIIIDGFALRLEAKARLPLTGGRDAQI
jgi:hypothetical protein